MSAKQQIFAASFRCQMSAVPDDKWSGRAVAQLRQLYAW